MSNQNPTENLIIYTFNNKILIRKRVNDTIGKSYVLCNDYHKCLTYTFHRGNLYYSYINTSMELTIRRTFDFNTIFLMENVYISPAFSPILISFNNNNLHLKQRRMIVIQLREYLLHDCLTEENGLGIYSKLLTITLNGSHLAVIKIDYLSMTTHKGFLLLLQILGIWSCIGVFLLLCQILNGKCR